MPGLIQKGGSIEPPEPPLATGLHAHAYLKCFCIIYLYYYIVSDINKWAQIGSGDHQRAFKIVSLYDSHKLDAPKPSIPFAILNKKKDIIELNEEALKLLKKITKPVAVLTISGPYRTGKSYFLSRVLGDKPVFETSEEMDPCTKGMTMATMVLDCGDFVIVLFDTEGTDSIGEQPGEVAVSNFIILSSLLSSVLVYNSQGTPKRSDVDKMRCVSFYINFIIINTYMHYISYLYSSIAFLRN